jgi:hypothetical protein
MQSEKELPAESNVKKCFSSSNELCEYNVLVSCSKLAKQLAIVETICTNLVSSFGQEQLASHFSLPVNCRSDL